MKASAPWCGVAQAVADLSADWASVECAAIPSAQTTRDLTQGDGSHKCLSVTFEFFERSFACAQGNNAAAARSRA
jgi:hypothetical protein